MKKYEIVLTKKFHKDFKKLPKEIQQKAKEQIRRLATGDFSFPSLRVKKMAGEENIWEASVTMNYRIIFQLEKKIIFLKIGTHDILGC